MAPGGAGRRHRPGGLLQRPGGDEAGADPRQPADADDDPVEGGRVHGDRDPGGEARLRARLPVGAGCRRPRRAPALERLVRVREAVHARSEASRGRVRRCHRLDVGVGDVQRRRRRPRQAGGRVRLPVDARPEPLRRAGRRRRRLRRLAHRGADRAAPGRPVCARRQVDAADRPLAHDRGHPRPGRRLHDPVRPAGRDAARGDLPDRVRQAEQAIVDGVFGGNRPAFNAALGEGGGEHLRRQGGDRRRAPARADRGGDRRFPRRARRRFRRSTRRIRTRSSGSSRSLRPLRGSATVPRASPSPRRRRRRSSGCPRRSPRRSPPASARTR